MQPYQIHVELESLCDKAFLKTVKIWNDALAEYMMDVWPGKWRVVSVSRA